MTSGSPPPSLAGPDGVAKRGGAPAWSGAGGPKLQAVVAARTRASVAATARARRPPVHRPRLVDRPAVCGSLGLITRPPRPPDQGSRGT